MIGFLCGRTTIRRSLNWCRANIDWLRGFLPLENGIASPSTISRMLSGLDEELFLYAFMEWIGEIVDTKGSHLAIDGKALRGATEKVKMQKTPMIMNAVEVFSGLVVAQLPVKDKENEIVAIPRLLQLLDISGSTITIDAIGTQTAFMEQIHEQGGHFVLEVKKNQPEAYAEIHRFMEGMEEAAGIPAEELTDSVRKEYLGKYEEASTAEKNRDRYEYRTYQICNDASELTRAQKEWSHVKSLGRIVQIRIPVEKDSQGNDITPTKEEFLRSGSRRIPFPVDSGTAGKDIQCVAMVSDRQLGAKEMGNIKRNHWTIENRLHHVLDDTFREDRSSARSSRNNLALIRKFAYNLLRLALMRENGKGVITEMMDSFCDDAVLREKYVFKGIVSLY